MRARVPGISGRPYTTTSSQPNVERVDLGGREVSDGKVTDVRVEIAIEHGTRLADRRWGPAGLGDREPCLKEFAHR
jgi:hypothetical protein